MNEKTDFHEGLVKLGNQGTKYVYDKPEAGLLERFPSPFADSEFNRNSVTGTVKINCPEFTSLCPKTGQPDFATIIIEYEPGEWCVESKSLKLYLGSFRMTGEFHESCVTRITNDLVDLLRPNWIQVKGEFTPRGGIPFWPTCYWNETIEQDRLRRTQPVTSGYAHSLNEGINQNVTLTTASNVQVGDRNVII